MPTTQYIGSSGEFVAAAYLQRLGLNTTPLPIDSGLDLLGHLVLPDGESRSYLFQVKTTARSLTTISFTDRKFADLLTYRVNLVVVLWPSEPAVAVFPPRLLRMMTSDGFNDPDAPIRRVNGRVNIRVELHEGRLYVRRRCHDFTGLLNRLDLSEPTDVDSEALPEYAVWSEPPQCLALDPDPPPRNNPNTLGEELQLAAVMRRRRGLTA